MNGVPLAGFIALSMFMFITGVVGVIIRRNPIVIFMCIELMLNAVNLAFLAFARYRFSSPTMVEQGAAGQMMVIFVMAVAAAEVAVGLGIIMAIYRLKENIDVDELNLLKG
jgi:NADH-quinone oxidoreductase subunit K